MNFGVLQARSGLEKLLPFGTKNSVGSPLKGVVNDTK